MYSANLSEEVKYKLFFINKNKLWYYKNVQMPKRDEKGKKIKGKFIEIDAELMKLARHIMKQVLRRHNKPNLKRCNLALDNKVAKVQGKEKSKNKNATEFDYWVILSTLEKRKPIALPLKTNDFFEKQNGKIKKFCQINIQKNKLVVCLIKDVEKVKNYEIKTPEIALDFGLRTLFSSNYGDLFSRDFMDKIKKYDKKICKLAQNRQRQRLKVKSARYQKYISKLRNLLKNEINRVINRVIEVHNSGKIIIECLDFRNPNLSKAMNRLLSNFGKSFINEKLQSVEEKFSIHIDEVNPAYTSKTCSSCGYVDQKNRLNQSKFSCKHCKNKIHADVNAAKNILQRSSDQELKSSYLDKRIILKRLIERFLEKNPNASRELLDRNHYFKAYFADSNSQQKKLAS